MKKMEQCKNVDAKITRQLFDNGTPKSNFGQRGMKMRQWSR